MVERLTFPVAQEVYAARLALQEADRLLSTARACHVRAGEALERALKGTVQTAYEAPEGIAQAATEHRRQHRPGRPARIDTDPELEAFIRARIDHFTFHEIATQVAAHFPPNRAVRHSAIHAWWQRNR